mmetsp:Transcript_14384/g.33249  ORF Transcript_14384/g.33249 Transcript_14384/m.33249 type:complete len:276 (+) Transcript_14384:2-829(+)
MVPSTKPPFLFRIFCKQSPCPSSRGTPPRPPPETARAAVAPAGRPVCPTSSTKIQNTSQHSIRGVPFDPPHATLDIRLLLGGSGRGGDRGAVEGAAPARAAAQPLREEKKDVGHDYLTKSPVRKQVANLPGVGLPQQPLCTPVIQRWPIHQPKKRHASGADEDAQSNDVCCLGQPRHKVVTLLDAPLEDKLDEPRQHEQLEHGLQHAGHQVLCSTPLTSLRLALENRLHEGGGEERDKDGVQQHEHPLQVPVPLNLLLRGKKRAEDVAVMRKLSP